jgi:hypothetical protein
MCLPEEEEDALFAGTEGKRKLAAAAAAKDGGGVFYKRGGHGTLLHRCCPSSLSALRLRHKAQTDRSFRFYGTFASVKIKMFPFLLLF